MKTIRIGDRGDDVRAWQEILNLGDPPDRWTNARGQARRWARPWPLVADGIFGAGTEEASEAWQAAHALEADGIVGPASWAKAGISDPTPDPAPLLYGTDISAVQGKLGAATWKALREMGIRFAFMRAIVGNEAVEDGVFRENTKIAEDNGITTSFYLFAFPLRHIDPRKQVDDWVRRLGEDVIAVRGMPPALDLEWPPREEYKTINGAKTLTYPWGPAKWNLSAASIRDWGCAALERGRELTGAAWFCYSFRYFLDCIEASKAPELGESPLWLADYTNKGRFPTPAQVAAYKVPRPWSEIVIVQHDGDGGQTLPGGKDADFNVMTGGEARLASLAARQWAPETFPEVVHPDVQLANQELMNELRDEQVAAYRAERLNDEPQAA